MKKRFSIIIVCLLAASCGTVRSVSQEQVAVSSMSAFDSTAINRTIESMVREQIASALQVEKLEELQVVHETFGDPDSTGTAPIKERTTTKYKSDTHTLAQADVQRVESRSIEEKKDSVSVRSEAEETQKKRSETPSTLKRMVPGIVKTLAWLGGLAILALFLYLLKKFRIL